MLLRKGILITVFVGVVFLLGVSTAVVETQKTSFCLSCHVMEPYLKELEASSHARDAQGRPISCAQCHVPSGNIVRMLAGKSYSGSKHLLAYYTKVPLTLDRAALQPVARRFVDDANCRACHEDLNRNAKNDGPVSAEGRLAHDAYLGISGQTRSGCAGCHANTAHLPIFDERIPRNATFLKNLKESQP